MNKEKAAAAKALFMEGYNCSQAVVGAWAEDIGLDSETAYKIASGFGGGIGRMREVCGAMCGAAMVAGMVYGDDTGENREAKSYTYKKVQEIAAEFKKTNPSIICRELLGLSKNCAVTPNAEKRTAEYYKKRPCAQIVEDAVKATEKVLFSD